ncbi:hypothetical protein BJX70DRAFT_122334 [Aspergillus crustosus]
MTGFSSPTTGLLSGPALHQVQDQTQHENPEDLDGKDDPTIRNVNVTNTFALMRAVVELRVLQTTTSILRRTRTNPVSIKDPNSSFCRAMDRRKQRIAYIIDSMTKDDIGKDVCEITSDIKVAAQPLPRWELSPSEMIEALNTGEDVGLQGEEIFRNVSSTVSAESIPKLNTLVTEDDPAVVDESVHVGVGLGLGDGPGDDGKRIPSDASSSVPTYRSDSVYSSVGRSLSASNMHSNTSVPRQCKVVSAAQYTKIVSGGEPQFSLVGHPYSIDSLVAESTRVDRSALEINEHHQMKSADSFPGRFPISEGIEYSALATAKHHTRMPSIRTSVRPFSDL